MRLSRRLALSGGAARDLRIHRRLLLRFPGSPARGVLPEVDRPRPAPRPLVLAPLAGTFSRVRVRVRTVFVIGVSSRDSSPCAEEDDPRSSESGECAMGTVRSSFIPIVVDLTPPMGS